MRLRGPGVHGVSARRARARAPDTARACTRDAATLAGPARRSSGRALEPGSRLLLARRQRRGGRRTGRAGGAGPDDDRAAADHLARRLRQAPCTPAAVRALQRRAHDAAIALRAAAARLGAASRLDDRPKAGARRRLAGRPALQSRTPQRQGGITWRRAGALGRTL